MYYKSPYWHLLFSGDNCCSSSCHYAVMSARSSSPLGPFQEKGDAYGVKTSAIIESNNNFVCPGHNSVVTDSEGNDWMYYHGYHPGNYGPRVLLLDRILYDNNGWPYVNGNGPSAGNQNGPNF